MTPPPRRILVIMLRRIGDVLLTTPAVRALRKLYPEAVIDFLVEAPAHVFLQGNPDLSGVQVYSGKTLPNYLYWLWRVRKARYDWVIDYMGTPRTAVLTAASGAPVKAGPGHVAHRWAYNRRLLQSSRACYTAIEKIKVLRSLGLDPDESDCVPRLTADAASEEFALSALARMRVPRGAPIVGICPASRRDTRRWPAGHFAELGRRLRDAHGAALLVFWGPGELDLARKVRDGIGEGAYLPPECTLRQLAALIGRCRMVVTNCNGPKHIAVARDIPTLTVHGATDPACWNPPDLLRYPVVRLEELHCIGCRSNRCRYQLECLRDLSPERVFREAERLLRGSSA